MVAGYSGSDCVGDGRVQYVPIAFSEIAIANLRPVLTVIDSFENTPFGLESNGQGVGSVFLWLLPIGKEVLLHCDILSC